MTYGITKAKIQGLIWLQPLHSMHWAEGAARKLQLSEFWPSLQLHPTDSLLFSGELSFSSQS